MRVAFITAALEVLLISALYVNVTSPVKSIAGETDVLSDG